MTLCGEPPFQIRSISHQPIIDEDLYQGPWLWKSADFVVYPIGIIVLNNTVWVSVGYQNKEMLVYTFDLKRLLHNLQTVRTC
jgi:hypothetical protein